MQLMKSFRQPLGNGSIRLQALAPSYQNTSPTSSSSVTRPSSSDCKRYHAQSQHSQQSNPKKSAFLESYHHAFDHVHRPGHLISASSRQQYHQRRHICNQHDHQRRSFATTLNRSHAISPILSSPNVPGAPVPQSYATSPSAISIDEYHERSDTYIDSLVAKLEEIQEEREDVDVAYSVCTTISPASFCPTFTHSRAGI